VLQRFFRHLKKKSHHFFFLCVLACLVLVTGWWTLFIKKMIEQSYDQQIRYAYKQAEVLTLQLKLAQVPVMPGLVPGHKDFEIIAQVESTRQVGPRFSVQPTMDYLVSLEQERNKRTAMVFGEGSLLGLSVLVSCFMLYQLIRLEKRAKEELYEFWNRVTHEIKTPITGIRAFLETLKRGTLSGDDLNYMVDLALKQVERQQQLTQNILVGRQLEKGLKQQQMESLEIVGFIKNYIHSHNLQLARIETEVDPGSLPPETIVHADPNSVHTILDNLVDNAIKYGPANLRLQFSFEIEDQKVHVRVKDNGPGFPPELADHLFDAYRRLAGELPEGKHGTGMGLHICRSLARHMGGEMTASSEGTGTGATFTVILKQEVMQP